MEREMSRWEFFDGVSEKTRSLKSYALSKMENEIRWKNKDISNSANCPIFHDFAIEHFENYWNSAERLGEDIACDMWHDIVTMEDMWEAWDNIAATVRDQIPEVIENAMKDSIMEASLRGFYQGNEFTESIDSEYVIFCAWAAGLNPLTVYPAFRLFSNGNVKEFISNIKEKKSEMLSWAHNYVPFMLMKNRHVDLSDSPIVHTEMGIKRELSDLLF